MQTKKSPRLNILSFIGNFFGGAQKEEGDEDFTSNSSFVPNDEFVEFAAKEAMDFIARCNAERLYGQPKNLRATILTGIKGAPSRFNIGRKVYVSESDALNSVDAVVEAIVEKSKGLVASS